MSSSKGKNKSQADVGKLFDAARKGNTVAFVEEAEKDLEVLNVRNVENHTLLYFAARNNSVDIARFILENGVDPNEFSGPKKSTALHAASFFNFPNVVKLLLEHGAKFDIKNGFLKTAFQEARSNSEVMSVFDTHQIFQKLQEKKKTSQASYAIEMPYVLQPILQYLEIKDLLSCLKVSSLFFYATNNDKSLWEAVAKRTWPARANVSSYGGDWRLLCVNKNVKNIDVELTCEVCRISISGIACAGLNRGNTDEPVVPCKKNLFLSCKTTLSCPVGHGSMKIPKCSLSHTMTPKLICGPEPYVFDGFHKCQDYPEKETRSSNGTEIEIRLNQGLKKEYFVTRFFSSLFIGGPVFNCIKCKWGIYGIVCTTSEDCKEKGGVPLKREGFYERVWCAYVWNCMGRCSIKIHNKNFTCNCNLSKEGTMDIQEFEQTFGPPMN